MSKQVILCVDDDSSVLMSLRTLLFKTVGDGHVVVEVAQSGEEALEILDELAQGEDQLALIIADYIMPGMRGDELLVQVHQRAPDALTIMLTGQSDLDGVKRAINEANLFRFLEKP